MPHPFCTSTHIRLPPAGRPPLHRADARCTWALEHPPDRFRGVLRHEKKPEGYTSTPTGLKRLKTGLQRFRTQHTAFRIDENGKGTPSGVPKSIHKRKLILVKEEFDASSFGGHEGSRTLDLCNANAALSQLSYAPECLIAEIILHLFA